MWSDFLLSVVAKTIGMLLALGIIALIMAVAFKLEERKVKMGTRNDELFENLKNAVNEYFGDRSVGLDITRDRLEEVYDDLGIKLDVLDADIEKCNADDDDEEDDWLPDDELDNDWLMDVSESDD